MTVLGPTFEQEKSSGDFVIEQCSKVLFEIIEAEPWKSREPNESLSQSAGESVHLYGVKIGLKVLEHDNPRFIGWNKYINMWLSLNGKMAWQMKNIADQIGLDDVMRQFDVNHHDYVGEDNRPNFEGMDMDTMWESIANFYISGVLQTADGEIETDCGLIGNAFYASIGEPRKATAGKNKGQDQTGQITPLKASAISAEATAEGMV